MTILLRILRTAWQNILRQPLTATTAVAVILLLFLALDGVLFVKNLQSVALDEINSRLDIALTFEDEPSESTVANLQSELAENFPEIRETKFVSSSKAYENFLRNFESENSSLSNWLAKNSPDSPLPATLVISADAGIHAEILEFLKLSRYAGSLNLDNPATAGLASATSEKVVALDSTLTNLTTVAIVGATALAILILVAVLQLTIFSRREEIAIMRLVGATRAFVFLPFAFEAIFFTLAACLLSAILFEILLANFDGQILESGVFGGVGQFFTLARENFLTNFWLVLGWQILAALVVGWLGSLIATRRYLKRDMTLS